MNSDQKFIHQLERADAQEFLSILGQATAQEEELLRRYFNDEYEFLRLQVRAVRRRAAVRGNVVVLHGIMGGELTSTEANQDRDLVWVSFLRILAGELTRLELADDGNTDKNPAFSIEATGIMKRPYARMIVSLARSWNVHAFWYDWRKSVNTAAKLLNERIAEWFKADEPVHLVAHSMGGLVARSFIKQFPSRWKSMWDGAGKGSAGGRLVMLGTPNYGAVAIARVLAGDETLVKLAGAADLVNNTDRILSVFDSFVGIYQMLPSPDKLSSCAPLYKAETWKKTPIRPQWLKAARDFQQEISPVVDPDRMVYIAGFGQETVSGMSIENGQMKFTVSRAGDGRVPHQLGLLPGVPAYYVDEAHGNLPSHPDVIQATDDIMSTGATAQLVTTVPERGRSMQWEWQDDGRSTRLADEIRAVTRVRTARGEEGYQDTDRRVEQAIVGGFLGKMPESVLTSNEVNIISRGQGGKPQLEVTLVHGLVQETPADAAAVGHYIGVLPQAAEAGLDSAVDGLITAYTRRGVIYGDLGRVFILPRPESKTTKLKCNFIAIAGMGQSGRFGPGELTSLARELVWTLVKLKVHHLATVLIGSGVGNLDIEEALKSYLRGVAEALRESESGETFRKLSIVEADPRRFDQIRKSLDSLKQNGYFESIIDLEVKEAPFREFELPVSKKSDPDGDSIQPTRIHVRQDNGSFIFSAITNDATVPERQWELDPVLLKRAIDDLVADEKSEQFENLGYYLTRLLVPPDILKHMHGSAPLVLSLDNTTARIPWELMSLARGPRGQFLGLDRFLSRQFQTVLAPLPEKPEMPLEKLRILVVGNPTGNLPGAEIEANEVASLFLKKGATVRSLIGPSFSRTDVLRELIVNQYDILHYAGHCQYNEQEPRKSGWIFRDGDLTARELSRLDAVPRFVFNNSCESGIATAARPAEKLGIAPSFAEAFFAQGVTNIICTGWPVNDAAAVVFATQLYGGLLNAEPIWKSLKQARDAVALAKYPPDAWGAYQFYGNPIFKLVPKTSPATQPEAEDAGKVHFVFKIRKDVPHSPNQYVVKFKGEGEPVGRALRSATRSSMARFFESNALLSLTPVFAEAEPRASRGRVRLALPTGAAVDPELSSIHVAEVTRSPESERLLENLKNDPNVDYVHRVAIRYPLPAKAARAVAETFPRQWGLERIQLAQAQKLDHFPDDTRVGDIVVAVVDSGVDPTHPDLRHSILDYQNFTSESRQDKEQHGTHVSGIVAGLKSGSDGVWGVAHCRILALKALTDPYDGSAYYRALRYASDHADIINLSLGGEEDPTETLLIRRAIRSDRIVVAAMGNEYEDDAKSVSYPANIEGVIAVGASDKHDKRAGFSNVGKHIVLAAPGADILSCIPGGKHARWDGTSMATPFVSGAIALLLAVKKMSAPEVREKLIKSLDRVTGNGAFSEELGYGRLNVYKLLK